MQYRALSSGLYLPADGLGGTPEVPQAKPVDELLLNWLAGRPELPVAVYHDAFAVLATHLHDRRPCRFISDNHQHHYRHAATLARNGRALADPEGALATGWPALSAAPPALAVMTMPKYPELFEWYLFDIARYASPGFALAVSFPTRKFTPKLLTIAGRYAATVSQSRAYRKARLLFLEAFGALPDTPPPVNEITYRGKQYFQQYGVFSANHIDYATQFLLDSWRKEPALTDLPAPATLLDVGAGNGVIGDQLLRQHYPEAELSGTDVSFVAVQSARRNGPAGASYSWTHHLDDFPAARFDLIVTNPPFHEGHRNTTKASERLFAAAARKLRPGGAFVCVSNLHLNYRTRLRRHFSVIRPVAANRRFEILLAAEPLAVAG